MSGKRCCVALFVIPAQAGIQSGIHGVKRPWAPAFAGVTVRAGTGSVAERQEFFATGVKPPCRFGDSASPPFMTADGWRVALFVIPAQAGIQSGIHRVKRP
jgi:hypothetical protein